ncbi:MAG: arylesterase [Gammaproteobacteria bacterium]|nr:arylesterase [Gammaproteobacteria bacterium]
MKYKSTAIVYFFIFVITASCSDNNARFSKLPANATILAFGDSLTKGNGAALSQSYPSRLQQLTRLRVINAGISGEISEHGLNRLASLLEKHRPQLVIICHGGNDILRHLRLEKTKTNITEMIRLARSYHAQVLLMAVPKPSLLVKPADFYADIAESTRVGFDNWTFAEVLKNNALKSDSYHPNAAGYAVIADAIFQLLSQQGAI